MLISAISTDAMCFVGKVCGPFLVELRGYSRGGKIRAESWDFASKKVLVSKSNVVWFVLCVR